MSAARPRVVVVGAGPVGCSAAILLAQHGVECLVVDRWAEVYPQPRAVHLDDEVHRLLGRMHVAEEFAKVSRPGLGLQLVDRHQRILGRFTRLPEASVNGYPQANMYDQPELEAVLRDRLHSLTGVSFRSGVEVTGVTIEPDGRATVAWTDLDSGTPESATAEFVLGADGANSIVRSVIGADLEPLGFEQRWLVIDGEVDAELGHWEGTHQLCDARRAGTYMRIGAERHRWEFRLLSHETLGDFASPADLEPLLRPWLGRMPMAEVRIVRTAEYTFRAAVADRWRRGQVFLLGDAAHLTPPFIGQGLGSGLRDADNLAWKLAGVLDGQLDRSVLETYEAERIPHARALIQLAKAMGMTMTGGGRLGTLARRVLVPPLMRILGRFETTGRGSTPPLSSSAVVLAHRGDRLAGRLCPNVVGGRLLDERIGGSWALVTRAAPAPSLGTRLRELGCVVVTAVPGDELDAWLAAASRTAALVRPDATVMASGEPAALLTALSRVAA